MNFPTKLLTGTLAEHLIEGIFLSWGWLPGQDKIDLGYDLSVEPDRATFRGARFLVQSKGTVIKGKRSLTVQVTKSRLRTYYENPHPVFICRVLSDKRVLWIHAQAWCRSNRDRLSGSGSCGIKFDPGHDLSDKEAFTEYLTPLLQSPARRMGGISEVAEERAAFLSSLDERLSVKVTCIDGQESYHVHAREGTPVLHGNFRLDPTAAADNVKRFRDVIEYGVPAEIQVDNFQLTGSPLFTELGSDKPSAGTMLIRQAEAPQVTVLLAAGDKFRLTARTVAIDCKLYGGSKGSVILNKEQPSLFETLIRLTPQSQSRLEAHLNISVRSSTVTGRPLRSVQELEDIVEWVDQIEGDGRLYFAMVIDNRRINTSVNDDQLHSIGQVLHFMRYLGKLRSICNYSECDFTLPSVFQLSKNELLFIDIVYAALRGERVPINLDSVDVVLKPGMEFVTSKDEYVITTAIELTLLDQFVGSYPVAIDIEGFKWIELEQPLKWSLTKNIGGTALLRFFEGDMVAKIPIEVLS